MSVNHKYEIGIFFGVFSLSFSHSQEVVGGNRCKNFHHQSFFVDFDHDLGGVGWPKNFQISMFEIRQIVPSSDSF